MKKQFHEASFYTDGEQVKVRIPATPQKTGRRSYPAWALTLALLVLVAIAGTFDFWACARH